MIALALLDDARLLQIAISGSPGRFNPAAILEPYNPPVRENVLPELISKSRFGSVSLGDKIRDHFAQDIFNRSFDLSVASAVLEASTFADGHLARKDVNFSISEEGAVLLEWGSATSTACLLLFVGDGTVVSSIASPQETFSAAAAEFPLNNVPPAILDKLKAIV